MKLNFDAMRELLFVFEDQPRNIDINTVVLDPRLKNFDKNDLGYAIEKLIEAKFLNGTIARPKIGPITFTIDSITIEGHKFLDNVRNDNVWTKAKDLASNAGLTTVKELSLFALEAAKAWTKDYLNL